jgi:antitoxin VapB
MPEPNPAPRHVRLFRADGNQVVHIPKEFELPGNEAIMSRDGDRLIIEPMRCTGLVALLDSWEPLAEEFSRRSPIRRRHRSLRRPERVISA